MSADHPSTTAGLRIVFAGSPAAAVPSLRRLLAGPHRVVATITREDSPVGRRAVLTPTPVAAAAEQAGVPVIRADRLDDEVAAQVARLRPDLGVIVAYGGLVREPLLGTPRLGWINVHFSLLPRWRGAAPVQHAILAGDTETGACVFRLVPELDAGDVLGRVRMPIGRFQTSGVLLERLADAGASLLGDVVDALAAGTATAEPQTGVPTFAPKLSSADGVVDWSSSAVAIDRLIRAVTPEPGASTTLDGQRFKVLEAAIAPDAPRVAPGRVERLGGRVLVGTGDDPIELLRVQPAGKKPMAAADWARGRTHEAVFA